MRYFILILFGLIILAGCTETSTNKSEELPKSTVNPTAADVLNENSNADIFQFNNLVYAKGSRLAWMQGEDYQKAEQIGVITKKTSNSSEFGNGTATKLPAGTKIFNTTKEHRKVLIAENDGEKDFYIALIEG
ncbi:hypothetical protein [Virgibacillus oceani]|uniref:Lipoprotein n=1 Tax=Virgibacillus oceani TaxID=1479511 RepID=A0A917HQE9_9BACI|nr:hypothetical protein [Virgibacillus oceani]GGG86418.1 hypothetical protein GCM10011398_35260 [Virgibacillus oceani]